MGTPILSLNPIPEGLPEDLTEIVTKLQSYGFELDHYPNGLWNLTFPPGDLSGWSRVSFVDMDLATGLLRVLRSEEEGRQILFRYEQFDARWGKRVYGRLPTDTTIAAAGCGPTSLSIVLQYLMNDGSRPRDACYVITPPETAAYAKDHGRVSGHGTAGDPMIRGIKEQWPEFEGSRVTLSEAIGLLQEGKLIVWLCKGAKGWTKNRSLHRAPDVSYGGHYMVLAGVEGMPLQELFYVVDPGRNAEHAMRYTKYAEISVHSGGFWWVYKRGEPATRVSRGQA